MYAVGEQFERVTAGVEKRVERLVDGDLVTRHVGGAGVFATPSMIMLMEQAAHGAVEDGLPAGYTTVGYEVCVRHLARVEPGQTVVVSSVLKEVTGNRLLFDVSCAHGETLVGSGTHRRAIVPALA
jgi:fluoroacetyl-CoA thioesterase